MIKIIRISNTRNAWNGVKINRNEFNNLINLLKASNHEHTIKYKRGSLDSELEIGKE